MVYLLITNKTIVNNSLFLLIEPKKSIAFDHRFFWQVIFVRFYSLYTPISEYLSIREVISSSGDKFFNES